MLAKKPLTQRTIESLKATGARYMVYDALVPGFAVRVTENGYRSYVLCHRFPGSPNPTARAIGTVGKVSLEWARNMAKQWHQAIAEGLDPQAQRAETFRAIAEEYLAREGSKLRTAGVRKATLERLAYPALGDRPISEIKRAEIVRLLDRIEDERGSAMADRTLVLVQTIMNWHAGRSEFRSPIVKGMASRHDNASRQRTLTDDELRAIWACEGMFAAYVKFMLLTCTRRNEAAGLRRSELVNGDWIIPKERYKTDLELVIPLSSAARQIIDAMPNLGDLVFTHDGSRPVSGFDLHKRKLDEASGVGDWRLHDTRRTARSLLSKAGVNADIAERCMGHVGGVRGTYDRYSYHPEKKHAFEALATQLDLIVNPSAANVVPMVQR
jgi:integrase